MVPIVHYGNSNNNDRCFMVIATTMIGVWEQPREVLMGSIIETITYHGRGQSMEKGRRWKRRHQEARLPTKKPKSHQSYQSYHRKNLSTEQVKYREQVASQLQDGENIDCIPPQAFGRKERHLQPSMPKSVFWKTRNTRMSGISLRLGLYLLSKQGF